MNGSQGRLPLDFAISTSERPVQIFRVLGQVLIHVCHHARISVPHQHRDRDVIDAGLKKTGAKCVAEGIEEVFSPDVLFQDAEKKMEKRGIKKVSFDIEVGKGLQPAREEAEKNIILKMLRDTNFNVYKSAKLLGVKRESLYYFIKKFGLKREGDDEGRDA